jgi:hypothetical protein
MDSFLARRFSFLSFVPVCLVGAAVLVGCTLQADLNGPLGTVNAASKHDPSIESGSGSSSGHGGSGSGADAGACDDVYGRPCSYPAADGGLASSSGWGDGADGGVASSSGWGDGADGGVASSSGWGGDSDAGEATSSSSSGGR